MLTASADDCQTLAKKSQRADQVLCNGTNTAIVSLVTDTLCVKIMSANQLEIIGGLSE